MSSILANRLARSCAYSTKAPEWEEFVRLVTPVIGLAAWRACTVWGEGTHATVNEIVQDVFVKLCEDERRILREFEDRGNDSFLKLLRVITVTVTADYFRRNRAQKRGGRVETVAIETPGRAQELPDAKATGDIEWPMLIAQLDGLLRLLAASVTERDRTLFWLYYKQGLTAEAISRIPAIKLSQKGVESALLRVSKLLRETVENGKPKREPREETSVPQKNAPQETSVKGFSSVISIDSVKRR